MSGLSDNRIIRLSTLSLHHFRNYNAVRLEVGASPVVLFGRNGSGKTNILEAISLLIPGRGLRRATFSEMDSQISTLQAEGEAIQFTQQKDWIATSPLAPRNDKHWVISANIMGAKGEVQIGSTHENTSQRIVKIDGNVSSPAALTEHCAILWLTPQMEQLFNETSSAARKFLDRLVYSFDAAHATRINYYETAMRERNKLLENRSFDDGWLASIEHTMAENAAAIASARLNTIEHLNMTIDESHLSFPKAHIAVEGEVEQALLAGKSASQAELEFAALLRANRAVDAASGRTQIGTHRSRLVVIHREKAMRAELCSTGEQKALLLSIMLAELRSGARWSGRIPMLLLDEVVAHLDPIRKLELFEEICESRAQVWMTGTDASLFDGIKSKAQMFEVENGTIK